MNVQCCGVTLQDKLWQVAEEIGDKEGRLDICVAAAGIATFHDALTTPADMHRKVRVFVAKSS